MTIETSEESSVDESDGSSFPVCSACGSPVVTVTVSEPLEGVASPCGCRVSPETLESE
ncbi:hypothetical protein [Natronorubrum halalkaliphilum]|uniref:hypothetical protein n=1 Tax=Natronorubrum halalkaliphilum TaxID=2691917 RepID=UPI00135764EC|nr:hypothetical protein [Natronorubrum halalkaliphilum]